MRLPAWPLSRRPATTASHARRAGATTRARHHAAARPRPATLGAAGRRARPPSLAAVAPTDDRAHAQLRSQARAVPHAHASYGLALRSTPDAGARLCCDCDALSAGTTPVGARL